ncbi:MAG: 3,4-dihydroxy-2-butanone-4-phosphate synthase [Flavobacteriales bacterium]|nr:3,4-dihydroxy-2-butanone-4-phosphate synthase [Flavobacteriales bacterium]
MLNTIEEAIEEIKNGKVVIVVDDEDRENEGDFVAAAELITPEIINFMSLQGRGLICTPIPEKRSQQLGLELMVGNNTDPNETAFTVSIDLIGDGVTTGISASDRAKTILAMMDDSTKPTDFAKPGHIFPLKAKGEGVLRRPGHTEAAVDLARLAGLKPGGVIVEIMNEDGTMARLPELKKIAERFDLKIISIKDLIEYRLKNDSLVEQIEHFEMDSAYGVFEMFVFRQKFNDQIHIALKKGNWEDGDKVPVRVISSSMYHDIFTALAKGENPSLKQITDVINTEGKGVIVFINNVVNSEILLQKVQHFRAYLLNEIETPSVEHDNKDLGIGVQILKNLNVTNIRLITRNPKKISLDMFGMEVSEFLPY